MISEDKEILVYAILDPIRVWKLDGFRLWQGGGKKEVWYQKRFFVTAVKGKRNWDLLLVICESASILIYDLNVVKDFRGI